jgi:photosystem II stability/assembly factor-like uncharacterized protein
MAIIKSYYVGDGTLVKRQDGLTGGWEDISLISSLYNIPKDRRLFDVKTSPTNKDKVFIVGQASPANGYFGIYVSYDGGTTWTIPGGDYISVITQTNNWYEVSVVDDNVIYVSGPEGWVCKSTDGGNSFNLCTRIQQLPGSLGGSPSYHECKSLHFISPVIGVVGLNNNVVITMDGGVTWLNTCGGNGIEGITPTTTNPGYLTGVHISNDLVFIVAAGRNSIVTSQNTGGTFTNSYQWQGGNTGLHLTWTTDYYLWGTGEYGERTKSTDRGVTWTQIGNHNVLHPDVNALHIFHMNAGYISGDQRLFYSPDNLISSTLSDTANTVINAVWTYYEDTPCYLLTDCDTENAIEPLVVTNDLSAYVGQVVKICNLHLGPTVIKSKATTNQSYTLRDCCGEYPDINVIAPLSQYSNSTISVYIPSLSSGCWNVFRKPYDPNDTPIDITGITPYENCTACRQIHSCPLNINIEGCKCFTVSLSDTCRAAVTITYDSVYATCELCNSPCYVLTNCEDNSKITTYEDLSQYLGSVVQLERCPTSCWTVSIADNCEDAVCVTDIINVFNTCELCLPQPEPQPVQPINYRIVKPGYYTGTCDSNYYERVMLRYAEAAYKEMSKARYGIEICCDIETEKWIIKKELMDLQAIYDESLCQSIICCPPCDVTAELFYFGMP